MYPRDRGKQQVLFFVATELMKGAKHESKD